MEPFESSASAKSENVQLYPQYPSFSIIKLVIFDLFAAGIAIEWHTIYVDTDNLSGYTVS